MKSFTVATALVAAISGALATTIDTPGSSSVVFCQPLLWTWHDGTPPYYLTIVAPGNTKTYETLLSNTTETSFTWTVDLTAGTNFNAAIKDATGKEEYTSQLTVQVNKAADASCVSNSVGLVNGVGETRPGAPADVTTPAAGVSTTAAAGAGSSTAAAGGSSAPVSGSKSNSLPASSSTKASGSASPAPTGAASRNTVGAMGLAGLMGLVGAALF